MRFDIRCWRVAARSGGIVSNNRLWSVSQSRTGDRLLLMTT
eukprot:COSAG04_NODE_27905_length_279_cov_0.572222_1_plen_40_part_10